MAGTPNKITADVRALAQQHAQAALAALASIASDLQQPGAARVAACKEILDRGYGKAKEPNKMDFWSNVPMQSLTDEQLEDVANGRPILPRLAVTFIDPDETLE